ncbi:MAG TPA: NAD(P)H-hydrate epimerase [Gammaproteobacteria bacterium]|jgi:NAD(P)H-hydrate epimerase|nr:NAD(P)H-hydrate epimerase [Gammaproteobacteria bacterium]
MREADRRCIEELGIPGAVLMNAAGQAVFREVSGGPVGVVCGKGNNGGDGYVVARLALLAGYDTQVVLAAGRASVTGDAEVFLAAYERLGGRVLPAETEAAAAKAVESLKDYKVVVDALLGTGVSGDVRGAARAAIEAWPSVYTIAVDLPSGLNADTGEICGCAIRADLTVTFQFPKIGLLADGAQAYVGRLVLADIGIPEICADAAAWSALLGRTNRTSG